jgi:hypothetical protein
VPGEGEEDLVKVRREVPAIIDTILDGLRPGKAD